MAYLYFFAFTIRKGDSAFCTKSSVNQLAGKSSSESKGSPLLVSSLSVSTMAVSFVRPHWEKMNGMVSNALLLLKITCDIFRSDSDTVYCGFPSSCNAKRHALYKYVRAQLFNSGFSVTTTDSQDFKHAYAYNDNYRTLYRCSYLHLKNCAY